MPAPSPGTSTAFRLARIAAIVLGCLVFLYACEHSESTVLSDVWVEVAIAGGFGAAGLVAAWFEIAHEARRAEAEAARRGDDREWDDEAEQHDAPIHGNFPGRWDRADDEDASGDRVPRTNRGAWPESLRSVDDEDPPEDTPHFDFAATVAQALRTGWTGAVEAGRPVLAGCLDMVSRMRGAEPEGDVDLVDDGIDAIERTETGDLVIESGGWTMRARIAPSGDLVLHGRERGGAQPRSEWKWTFRPDSFPAVRAALGGAPGDLLDLLEAAMPHLEPGARHDPGAWLRANDIPATYREKGVSATVVTRELPVLRPGPLAPGSPRSVRRQSTPPGKASAAASGFSATAPDQSAYGEPDTRTPTRRAMSSASAQSPEDARSSRASHGAPDRPRHPVHDDAAARRGAARLDRRSGGDAWPTARPDTRTERAAPAPAEPDLPTRSTHRRDTAQPSGPAPRTPAEEPSRVRRRAPAPPEQPGRRHYDTGSARSDRPEEQPNPRDPRNGRSMRPAPPDDDAQTYRRPPANRQPLRQRDPYQEFEPPARPGTQRPLDDYPSVPRARSGPSDHHPDPTYDQPPPGRRHRRDQPSPSHEPTARRW